MCSILHLSCLYSLLSCDSGNGNLFNVIVLKYTKAYAMIYIVGGDDYGKDKALCDS